MTIIGNSRVAYALHQLRQNARSPQNARAKIATLRAKEKVEIMAQRIINKQKTQRLTADNLATLKAIRDKYKAQIQAIRDKEKADVNALK